MIQLRLYQNDCINRSRECIRSGIRRVILQMDTGGGKTPCACEIMKLAANNGKRSIFLAPARSLVDQCSGKLDDFGLSHGILMAGRGHRLDELIQVGSTATLLSRVLRRKTLRPPPADLIIVDECHRQGKCTKELLRLYPKAVLIGLSATPCRTDGKGLGGPDGFQQIVQAVPRSQLIAGGYLVPTKLYGPYSPDMALTKEERARGMKAVGSDGDYSPAFRTSRMDKPELVGDIVQHWKRLGEGRPTIFFGSSVSHSIHVAAAFNAAGIRAVHLDANSDDRSRQEVLGGPYGLGSLDRGEMSVLCNYGIAVEGVDVPCVGCVILGRPTKSFIVYKQALGRACRPYPGPLYEKRYSICLDHAGNWQRFQPYGMPDVDIDWHLEEGKSLEDAQKEKDKDPPRLINCPNCYAVFVAAPCCPECGHVMKKQRVRKNPSENKAGLLVEIGDPAQEQNLKSEKLRRVWQKSLAIAAARDTTCGAALAIFRRETGLLPWSVPGLPHVPQGSDDWKKRVRDLYPGYWRGTT